MEPDDEAQGRPVDLSIAGAVQAAVHALHLELPHASLTEQVGGLKPIGPNPQTHWSHPSNPLVPTLKPIGPSSNPLVPAQPANTLVGTLDGLVCRSGKLHRIKLQRLTVGASLSAGGRGRG